MVFELLFYDNFLNMQFDNFLNTVVTVKLV